MTIKKTEKPTRVAKPAAAGRVVKKSTGFTDAERAAMKERAQELKAEVRAGKNKADGERAVLAKFAEMPPAGSHSG
jgi:hypothetical protein